ncbi:holin [Iodobacter fluviatilis]|uniref:Holin n=1 Tax=Iodobacter fluviatilis TaxID=537 RepID=A0A7G3GBY2_9NEIS|nr:holin [Iodobacter fluviatilis]QBC44473.1 holin [Iodobacter fluviatilis]
MQEHEKNLVWLLLLGAAIGLGKLLVSQEELTVRLVIGRSILGSATTAVAGALLIQIPDLPPLALMAVGCALGITGAQFLEMWLKKQVLKLKR